MNDIQIVEPVEQDDDSHDQYVTFQVGSENFGFSMQAVREIIRIPHTVDVPLTPTALVGLTNLRGAVLPILDLRTILDLPAIEFNESMRVVITDIGTPVGLIVDRVLQVTQANEDNIDRNTHMSATVDSNMMAGVIKGVKGQALTQLLNVQEIISTEFKQVLTHAVNQENNVHSITEMAVEKVEDTEQLVSFVIDEQEYAFALNDVEEIVRMPEHTSQVPNTPSHVLGLIELRERLLPLVCLRGLFNLPAPEQSEHTRILVVHTTSSNGRTAYIGLVVDQVREVLSVNQQQQDAVPNILSQQSNNDIDYICRLEKGKRLVSVLNANALFNQSDIQMALDSAHEQEDENMNQELIDNTNDDDNDIAQLVVFALNKQEFAVSIDDVQEITRIPTKLDKVPKTAEYIEGMVNLRGTVMPVIDLRTRFDIERMSTNDRQRIIVLSIDGKRTGFIVDSVVEVIRLPLAHIEEAPQLSDDQAKFMSQVINLKAEKRMIQVLSVAALINATDIDNLLEKAA